MIHKKRGELCVAARSEKKKPKANRLITFVLCIIILGLVVTMFSQQITMSKLKSEEKMLGQKIQEQKEEKARTEKQLDEQNENERIEQIAREQLGMLKPGERVFVDSSR